MSMPHSLALLKTNCRQAEAVFTRVSRVLLRMMLPHIHPPIVDADCRPTDKVTIAKGNISHSCLIGHPFGTMFEVTKVKGVVQVSDRPHATCNVRRIWDWVQIPIASSRGGS